MRGGSEPMDAAERPVIAATTRTAKRRGPRLSRRAFRRLLLGARARRRVGGVDAVLLPLLCGRALCLGVGERLLQLRLQGGHLRHVHVGVAPL